VRVERVLLDREVPYVPSMTAVIPEHGLLGGGREQAVPSHTNALSTDTDISEEVKRRFLLGLKKGISAPRI